MAVAVDVNNLPEEGTGDSNPETKHIPAGNRLARLVSYVELGVHRQMFNGKEDTYQGGKLDGKAKPPVLHIGLTFEFPTCDFTGDYPLTITVTNRLKNGDFMNAITVPEALANGTMSKGYAMKTKFMKYLSALQAATGKNFHSLADFAKAQVPLLIAVTNKKGKQREDGTFPIYANMKPEGIMSPKIEDPVNGQVTDYAEQIPATLGEYCQVFDWDVPTKEAWKALKPWDKEAIKAALNFGGSPIDMLLKNNPELDTITDGVEDHSDNTPAEPTVPGQIPPQEDIPV